MIPTSLCLFHSEITSYFFFLFRRHCSGSVGDKTTSKTEAYLLRGSETTHIQVTQGKNALRKFQEQGSTGLQEGTARPHLLGPQCVLWAATKVKIEHVAESHKHIWPKKTPILPGNHLKAFWARPGKGYHLFQKIKVFSNSKEHLPVFSIFLAFLLSSKIVNRSLQIRKYYALILSTAFLSLQSIFKWITAVQTF